MTWFKVDDKFHGSEEVMSIPLTSRAAAVGLWTLAGAWSSDHLKNGFVPKTHLEQWGGSPELADALVRAKLWVRVGRSGFQFRNWEKWQITREQVEANRDKEREKKAEWRAAKAAKQGPRPARVPRDIAGVPDVSPGDISRVPDLSPLSRPDPTRPDPTLITHLEREGSPKQDGPYCARHPGGTDEPCGPCRTARIAFEAETKAAAKPKAPVTKAYRRGDGHKCADNGYGYCGKCQERIKESK